MDIRKLYNDRSFSTLAVKGQLGRAVSCIDKSCWLGVKAGGPWVVNLLCIKFLLKKQGTENVYYNMLSIIAVQCFVSFSHATFDFCSNKGVYIL